MIFLRLNLRIWQAYCANALLTPPMADSVTRSSHCFYLDGVHVYLKSSCSRAAYCLFSKRGFIIIISCNVRHQMRLTTNEVSPYFCTLIISTFNAVAANYLCQCLHSLMESLKLSTWVSRFHPPLSDANERAWPSAHS